MLTARARGHPLTIRMVPPVSSDIVRGLKERYHCLSELAAECILEDRVHYLHERLLADIWWLDCLPGTRLCRLKGVCLEYRRSAHRRRQSQVQLLRGVALLQPLDAPNLHELRMNGVFLSISAPSLHSLKLDLSSPFCGRAIALSSISELLQQTPCLRSLELAASTFMSEDDVDNNVDIIVLPQLKIVCLGGSSAIVARLWCMIGEPADAILSVMVSMWDGESDTEYSSFTSSPTSPSSSSSSSLSSLDSDDTSASTESSLSIHRITDFTRLPPFLAVLNSKLCHPGHERLTVVWLSQDTSAPYDPWTTSLKADGGTGLVFSEKDRRLDLDPVTFKSNASAGNEQSASIIIEHNPWHGFTVVHYTVNFVIEADIPITVPDMRYTSLTLMTGIPALPGLPTLCFDVSDLMTQSVDLFELWGQPSLDIIEISCRHSHCIQHYNDCQLAWQMVAEVLEVFAKRAPRVSKLVILDDNKAGWDSFRILAGPADVEGLDSTRQWIDEVDDQRTPFVDPNDVLRGSRV